MQKLRIAIVVGTFPTVSETFIVNQIISLIEAGHFVQIFAFRKGNTQHIHSSIKKHNLLDKVIYFKKKITHYIRDSFFLLNGLLKIFFPLNRLNWCIP